MSKKILVVEKMPARVNHKMEFKELVNEGFEVDVQCMTEERVKTLRKADITIDPEIIHEYDHVILVGADPLKMFSASKGISDITGTQVVAKDIGGKTHPSVFAIVSFAMRHFRPDVVPILEKSVEGITHVILNGPVKKTDYKIKPITTESEALEWMEYCTTTTLLALDSETSALYPRDGRILGISMSPTKDEGVYIAAEALTDTVLVMLQTLVDDPKRDIVFHNAKFDLKWFTYHLGTCFEKCFEEKRMHDSMVLHYVLDERRGTHGLKQLAIKYTDLGDYDRDLDEFRKEYCSAHKMKQADFSYELIPFETMWEYGSKDTIATYQLYEKFKPIVYANPRLRSLYENILMPGTRFLNRMEERGVPISLERLEKCKHMLYSKIQALRDELFTRPETQEFIRLRGAEPNFNSPVQLRVFLYDICKIPPYEKYTDTGALSTDAEVLAKLGEEYDIAKLILEGRRMQKILNTYIIKMIDNVDRDGRLRTGFGLHTTTSGRLSSSGKLNLQQLPASEPSVKGCIVAPSGYKVVAVDKHTCPSAR